MLLSRTIEKFGRIDGAFANAGVYWGESLAEGDPDKWASMIDTNVNGVLRTIRAVLPHLIEQKSGDILMTGSIAGRVVFAGTTVYAATKHALYAIADGLRKEVCEQGVRVTMISPGYTANEIWNMTDPAEIAQEVEALTALQSSDIADAVVHALSLPPNVNIADMLVVASKRQIPGL